MTRDRPTIAELTAKLRELNLQRIANTPPPTSLATSRELTAEAARARVSPQLYRRAAGRQSRRRQIRGD